MYLVFAGNDHYPDGGWRDFKGSYPTTIAALKAVAGISCDWYQIVDANTLTVWDAGVRGTR